MYGLLVLGLSAGAIVLLASKLTIVLGYVVTVATFAFPLGLILLVGIGVGLICRATQRGIHWEHPE